MRFNPLSPSHQPLRHTLPEAEPSALFGIAGIILFSPLFVDIPVLTLGFFFSSMEPLLAGFPLGAMGAKFCLMAIWLAWGTGLLAMRFVVVALSLLPWALLGGQVYLMPLAILVIVAVAVAVPRWSGLRLVRFVADEAKVTDADYILQFRLADLFAWTFAAAILFGVLRLTGLPQDHDEFLQTAILLGALLSICAFVSLWAVLRPRCKGGRSMLVACALATAGATTTTALFFVFVVRDVFVMEAVFITATAAFIATLVTCLVLGTVRESGRRLVRVPREPAPQLVTPPSATTMIHPLDGD